jgi:hypothetical protein
MPVYLFLLFRVRTMLTRCDIVEIMDILRQKKGQVPPPSRRQERRKITSAAMISDDEDGSEKTSSTPVAAAGSSTGPGTLAGEPAQHQQAGGSHVMTAANGAAPKPKAKKASRSGPRKDSAQIKPTAIVAKDYRMAAATTSVTPPEISDDSSESNDSDDD